LKSKNDQKIIGHIFVKVIIDNRELYIDPTFNCIYVSLSSTPYIIALESKDFKSSGLTNLEVLQKFCLEFKNNHHNSHFTL
jgi:hypothetical protein